MVSRTRKHHGGVGMTYICNDCGTKYKDNNVNNEFFIPCPNCNSLNCSIDKLERELILQSERRKEKNLIKQLKHKKKEKELMKYFKERDNRNQISKTEEEKIKSWYEEHNIKNKPKEIKSWYEEHNIKNKPKEIKPEFIIKKCLLCNKEMILKNLISKKKKKFCSHKCSHDYRKPNNKNITMFKTKDERISDRIELLKNKLSEAEQDELEGIKEELEELTRDSSEYKCECAHCRKEIDIKEEWHYTNRRWILERIYELNTNNDPRHHIIPRKYGINNDETNKIFLCSKCHDYVEIKTEEWIQSGKRYDIDILKSMIINNGFEDEYLEKKEPTNMYIL